MSDVAVPDYAEPIELHRIWSVTRSPDWSFDQSSVKRAGNSFHFHIDFHQPSSPSYCLYSLNGEPWPFHKELKATCKKTHEYERGHPAPYGDCKCGIYGRTEFPLEIWKSTCLEFGIFLISKGGYDDLFNNRADSKAMGRGARKINDAILSNHSFFEVNPQSAHAYWWPVKGTMQLWGKLRKGAGADGHPKGYRGEFAKPKSLTIPQCFSIDINDITRRDKYDARLRGFYTKASFYLLNVEEFAYQLQQNYNCEVKVQKPTVILLGGKYSGHYATVEGKNTFDIDHLEMPALHEWESFVTANGKLLGWEYGSRPHGEDRQHYYRSHNPQFFIHESGWGNYVNGKLPWDCVYPGGDRSGFVLDFNKEWYAYNHHNYDFENMSGRILGEFHAFKGRGKKS